MLEKLRKCLIVFRQRIYTRKEHKSYNNYDVSIIIVLDCIKDLIFFISEVCFSIDNDLTFSQHILETHEIFPRKESLWYIIIVILNIL